MIKLLFAVSTVLALTLCTPEDTAMILPVSDSFDSMNATLLSRGTIIGIGHTAEGMASLYEKNGKHVLLLDPYSSQNGPDLKVYLSKDADATEYIRLGNLQSTMGKQSYSVPGSFDISEYDFVHVWCERYSVVFARAELQ